jgi:GT2 family glycosyltransferase
MTRPPVSAVLVNYNGKDYLESCVASLLREELEEILLVDSGSDDGAAQEIAARAQDAGWPLRLVDLGANLGPSAARNRGLREAQHDLVLLIDNDVELSEGSLERLCAALAEDERRALVQARSVLFDEPNIVHYDGGTQHYLGWASLRNWYRPLAECAADPGASHGGAVQLDIAISLCCLARRQPLLDVGGYDEEMFILVEDVALSFALRLAGYEVAVAENALCLHKAGTAGLSTRGASRSYAAHRSFLLSRNRWIFLLSHYRYSSLLLLTPAFAIYGLVHLAFVLRSGHLWAWLRGKAAVALSLGYILRRRRMLQRQRVRGDGQLFSCPALTFNPGLAEGGLRGLVQRVLGGILEFYWALVGWGIRR